MRILFISHYPGVGGANLSMLYLIQNLRSYSVESTVLIPKKGPIEDLLRANKIEYCIYTYASLRTRKYYWPINYLVGLLRYLTNIISALRISYRFSKSIDIIHANSSLVFVGCLLKKIMKVPLVWHLREFGKDDYNLIFPLGLKFAKYNYENADALIAISESIKKYYIENICPNANIYTIYNGVQHDKIAYRKKTNNPPVYKICIVGGISQNKNQIELVKAAHLLQGNNFKIDIIGEGSESDTRELYQLIQKYGLNDKIRLLGQRSDINSLLCNYDIGVITSKNEAFGRVIIEYMISGLAVVASNAGACPELVNDKVDGLLYELGNPEDLSKKLNSLINSDENLLSKYSLAGRNKAISLYTAKANAESISKLYNTLL
ncbi:MAG: glycosyltransferase family 4 protein [Oscillospiraceae bacterium]|nr:glycosyltransferase family 4 protein [Oscillospiraceae bacterium]